MCVQLDAGHRIGVSSGRRESNSRYRLPKPVRCHYATPWWSRTRESNPVLLVTNQMLIPMSSFGIAGNRGIEPRTSGVGGPTEPSSSPGVSRRSSTFG